MKKSIYFLFIVALISLVSCSNEDDPNNDIPETEVTKMKKYDIESGIIKFNVVSNLGVNYSYDIYFDEYGAKEARYEYNDMNILTEIVMQKADGWFYQVSLKYGSGIKSKSETANGTELRFIYEWTPQEVESYDYTLLSDTIICGKTCKKYSFASSESISGVNAGYKKMTLYSKSVMTGTLNVVSVSSAYSLEEDAVISDTIWNIPANIPLTIR